MVRKLVTKAKKWTWSVASWNKETKVLRRPVVGCVVVSACFGSYWHPKIRDHFKDGRYKKTTARVVLQQNLWPGTPQDTSIKSGVLARLSLQLYTKLYTKIFACPPKVTFTTSRFLHPETVSPVGYFLIPFKKLVQLVQNAQPIEFKG